MANTGNKQATIAYRVSVPGGEPVDVNGELISDSGRRQAIALLLGHPNPNPALYEVQQYFNAADLLDGNPTQVYGADDCPIGFMRIIPDMLVLSPDTPTGEFTIQSINAWQFLSGPTSIATIVPTFGNNGITIVGVARTATLGQGYFTFIDPTTGRTARIYIVNTNTPGEWILDDGTWDNLKFWIGTETWNY